MGLDIYFYAFPKGALDDSTDVKCTLCPNLTLDMFEIVYYRGDRKLNTYMSYLYKVKGGSDNFNCGMLKLTLDEVKRFRDTILIDIDDKKYQRRLNRLCNTVRKYINAGYEIYYSANW